jgi:hypothetical protein
MGEARNIHEILVGKYEGKRPLERFRPEWEYYIKSDRNEMRCNRFDWV